MCTWITVLYIISEDLQGRELKYEVHGIHYPFFLHTYYVSNIHTHMYVVREEIGNS